MGKIIDQQAMRFYNSLGLEKPDETQAQYLSSMMTACISRAVRKGGLSILDPGRASYPSDPVEFYEDSFNQSKKCMESNISMAAPAVYFGRIVPRILPVHLDTYPSTVEFDVFRNSEKKMETSKIAARENERLHRLYKDHLLGALAAVYPSEQGRLIFDYRFQKVLSTGDREMLQQFLEELGTNEEKLAARFQIR